MSKITALCSFAGLGFSAVSGEVLDLPDDIAEDLIRANYATKEARKNESKSDNEGDNPKPTSGKRSSAKSK